jgi:hypothetical protein
MNSWSFSEIKQLITYKAAWEGVPVIQLSVKETRGTSLLCPRCGKKITQVDRKTRELWCAECKRWMDRDVVAAMNLSIKGLARFASSQGLASEAMKGNPVFAKEPVILRVDASKLTYRRKLKSYQCRRKGYCPISEIDAIVHNPVNSVISFVLLISIVAGSFYYVYATDPKEPYLGIGGRGVTPAVAQQLGLQEARGLLIFVVDPGSPADVAGLRGGDRGAVIEGQQWALGGDVITAIDGVQIQGVDDAEELLVDKVAGDRVKFTIIRDGATLDVNVIIGEI